MSKQNGASEKTIRAWIDQGDGQGEGIDYIPFLRVQDVPSRGRSRKIKGLKNGRVMHYLSDLEYFRHVVEEFNPNVKDIREQFALLPWERTQEIAEIKGVKHPKYPKSETPIVMTTDLVVTELNDSEITTRAIAVKPWKAVNPDNPESKRVNEKLLIEGLYWLERGAIWELSTEQDIPMNMALNLDMLRPSMFSQELDYLNEKMTIFVECFYRYWSFSDSLNTILFKIASTINIKVEHCFTLFARSVWTRTLPVDVESELILHNFPVQMLKD